MHRLSGYYLNKKDLELLNKVLIESKKCLDFKRKAIQIIQKERYREFDQIYKIQEVSIIFSNKEIFDKNLSLFTQLIEFTRKESAEFCNVLENIVESYSERCVKRNFTRRSTLCPN